MKFVFIGKQGETEPKTTTVFGKTFERNGEAVEVTDEQAIKKLQNNPEFKEAGATRGRPKKEVEAEVTETKAE